MNEIHFLLAVHNHQPAGNFEHVFSDGWRTCYGPFLEMLKRHPAIRCTLHYTGALFEWIEANRPEDFAVLRELAARGQVELLGGGFYEPILPAIPRDDAEGQLRLMSDYLRERFGAAPRGMWLAERVWEPHLASLLRDAGLDYTLLDDTHFVYAGLDREELRGYYLTEDQGRTLAVFPIDKGLRYLIPFNEPSAAIDYLRQLAERSPGSAVTLGDDGEKFGMWPGTYKWVYEERYLERLFALLEENAGWIKMRTMGEYREQFPPSGRIYLPTASYDEMMEWALPAAVQADFEKLLGELKKSKKQDRLSRYLRGGFWRNFLVKYPESALQRAKTIQVSALVRRAIPEDLEAKKSLWRSQCNCAYWHGLFGGVYLNYLRHANYANALRAEVAADKAAHGKRGWAEAELVDCDADGSDELLLRSAPVNAFLSPGYGGSLFELDYKEKCFNLSNTRSRRPGAYHAAMLPRAAKKGKAADAPASIHDLAKTAPRGVRDALHYDWYLRRSFLDHFLGPGATLDSFRRCEYPEQGGFVDQPYEIAGVERGEGRVAATLKRCGAFHAPAGRRQIEVAKTYALDGNGLLSVAYRVANPGGDPLDLWMGIEFNLTLLSGKSPARLIAFDGAAPATVPAGSKGHAQGVSRFELVNREDGFAVCVSWDATAGFWYFPVETVSQSEKGIDLNYQGSSLMPHFRFDLPPGGAKKLLFRVAIRPL